MQYLQVVEMTLTCRKSRIINTVVAHDFVYITGCIIGHDQGWVFLCCLHAVPSDSVRKCGGETNTPACQETFSRLPLWARVPNVSQPYFGQPPWYLAHYKKTPTHVPMMYSSRHYTHVTQRNPVSIINTIHPSN